MSRFIEAAAGWLVRLADALLDLHDRAREAAAAELARAAGEAAHALVADALRPRPGGPRPAPAGPSPGGAGVPHPSSPATRWAAVELVRRIARRVAGPPGGGWLGLGAAAAGLAGFPGGWGF